MAAAVETITGAEARLSRNGTFGVRIMWMTMVWVQRLSRNQPVLKTAVKSEAPVPAAPQAPPAALGQTAK